MDIGAKPEKFIKLFMATLRAVRRNDTLVLGVSQLGIHPIHVARYLDQFRRIFGIPLCVYDSKVLLAFQPPKMAKTAVGEIPIVAYHDGIYYSKQMRYRENDIAWIEDKPLP